MTKEAFKVYVVKEIHLAVLNNVPENVLMKKMQDIIRSIPSLNMRECAALYRVVKVLADQMYRQEAVLSNKQIYRWSVNVNKIVEHRNSRVRAKNLAVEMQDSRINKQVFYLCSIHSNPAEDHKDYQGKIYVDRYWKTTLKDDPAVLKKVAAFIKNKSIITVQDICKAPVYMITRPYCMHYFIELDTNEVLNNGLKAVRRNHPEAHSREHHVDYRKKFLNTRKKIHRELGMEVEEARDKTLLHSRAKKEKEKEQ